MDLSKLKTWFATHRTAALGSAAAVVVGFALYQRHKASTASTTSTAAAVNPATTASTTTPPVDSTGTYTGGSYGGDTGTSSSSDPTSALLTGINSEVTALQQLVDGQQTTQTLLGQLGNPKPSSGSGAGSGGTGTSGHTGAPTGGHPTTPAPTPRRGRVGTTARQTDQYVIDHVKGGGYYDVTTRGTVHKLTGAQLRADRAAGANEVLVGSRPVPAAAKKRAPAPPTPRRRPAKG